jgi:membrane protease YdiL (CAAX protease family)
VGDLNMDGMIGTAAIVGMVVAAGAGASALSRGRGVSWPWLAAAAAFLVLNDALLTNGWRLLPDMIGGDWNWQGKLLALAGTLLVASLPGIGWKASGLTHRQAPGSLKPAIGLSLIYAGFFVGLALAFPGAPVSAETVAFQLTLPGLEEEVFYRGVLLLLLARAFVDRFGFLGVEWHWGALMSCLLFGLAHAFGYSEGRLFVDPRTMGLTAIPSVIGVWLALRTRSVLLPILLHNFGNTIMIVL